MLDTTLLSIPTSAYTLTVEGTATCLWSYQAGANGRVVHIAPPVFEVDGQSLPAVLHELRFVTDPVSFRNGVWEYRFIGSFIADPRLGLEIAFRIADGDPVLRVQYVLLSDAPRHLTKSTGVDALTYGAVSTAGCAVTEVRFSEFNEMVHSFCLVEAEVPERDFENGRALMGPMIVGQSEEQSFLLAYEHGSQAPDAFLQFHLDAAHTVTLRARKGNYVHGQPLSAEHTYRTLWLQVAAVDGPVAALAAAYRRFVLTHQSQNLESRKPYIFYNTWAYQERNQSWHGAAFLDSMYEERILREIDVAHRMGVEVFVLDTGWYEKTGDWRVNRQRFSDGLRTVKARLDGYGMKLGLWFSPTEAAVTSVINQQHLDCHIAAQGKEWTPHPVWETEDSHNMCLVSRYREAFAEELIRLVQDVGVTYFKWDAIGQYGCDAPGHQHGAADNTEQERADNYAFQLGLAMIEVVDRLCHACPEAIVDFDVTEGGRFVGLGFLSAGKYFLINNGPYFGSYDIPDVVRNWCNIFVWPGPARGWVCRTPLTYDRWIPSVLFLTHYLPDDPADSQLINIASLILGQNGIWGDLPAISDDGVARFGTLLGYYKQVRDAVTASTQLRTGVVGGSPEIYEKIEDESGKGVVCLFANARGTYTYGTAQVVDRSFAATDGAAVAFDDKGRAVITCSFDKPGAHIVFFGATG